MKKLLHPESFALKCDSPACGFCINNAGMSRVWLNFPCPQCGTNMLTEKDYKAALKFMRAVAWLNKWFGWLGREDIPPNAGRIGVNPHNGRLIVSNDDRRQS